MSDNPYSVLIYQREVNKYTFHLIKEYISNGTKVYFLTESYEVELYNYIQDIEEREIEYYKDKYLLSMNYDIGLSGQFNDYFVIEDGKISENLREELKEESFNIEQYDIEHLNEDKHVIIKAGAGTGKTKTMIDRTIYFRHKELATFKEIVMITFTNKAANEMKQKLYRRLEVYYDVTKDIKYLDWIDEMASMRIQTIHSFAKNFIEIFGDKIEIDRKSKIKSIQYEKYKILEELINQYRFKFRDKYQKFRYIPQYKIIKDILKIEQYLVSKGLNIIDNKEKINFGVDNEGFNHFLQFLLLKLSKTAEKYKYENDIIELNDLVISLKKFLYTVNIQNEINIKYMMIDEFQDTDTIQVEFIIWLIQNISCRIFVVGDIKQSIYRFRGAEYTAFVQFEDKLKANGEEKNIIKKSLKKNYRSNSDIIEKLNNFFYNISNLRTSREEVKYFTFTDDDKLNTVIKNTSTKEIISFFQKKEDTYLRDERIDYIITEIEKNNKRNEDREKEDNEDIAILVRSNRDLEEIVRKLEDNNIICKKEVSGGFYRSIAVREFYLMLKALLYPKVYINQYAFINSSYGMGIDNNTILEQYSSSNNYLKNIIENREEYIKLQSFMKRIKHEPFMKVLHELINEFNPDINYGIKILSNRNLDEEEEKAVRKVKTIVINYKMNLMHLFTILDKKFTSVDSSIIDLLRFVELMIETDDLEDEKMLDFKNKDNKYDVICMTVHKSKGLEFDHVIIPKTNNSFLHNNNQVKIFLNEESKKINIGYSVALDDLSIKNDIYYDFIIEENKEIIAEEIRLLYVALTRAKKTLHLNKNEIMNNNGKIHNWMDLLERGNLKDA